MTVPPLVLRIALIFGGAADLLVAIVCLFFPGMLGPLFDLAPKDPAYATLIGGEFAIVAAIYAMLLRDVERFRPFLWLVALDQTFAAGLVLLEIQRGHVLETWKTVGPIPLNVILAAIFILAARARSRATAA